MFKKIANKFKGILRNQRGETNLIGWAILIIFIVLVAVPVIKQIGQTIAAGGESINRELTETLGE